MPFKRVWDETCPQVYDMWEADGASWVIQDLLPEDDEEAKQLLIDNFIPDETLCTATGIINDPLSIRSMADYWKLCLEQRMSLACYVYKDNKKKLVALNCCVVTCQDDDEEDLCEIEGECWKNVYGALKAIETKVNIFKILGLDKVLYAMGLVVHPDYRGARLGARILKAREPLSRQFGIKGSSTVFTSIASQKSAIKAGFTTVAELSFNEMADLGLKYPRENKCIKLMVKRFCDE